MIRVTKLILTWRFFTELKDKGIKNEQKRIVNGGGSYSWFYSAHAKESRKPRLILECYKNNVTKSVKNYSKKVTK